MNLTPKALLLLAVLTVSSVAVGCDDTADDPGVGPNDPAPDITYDQSIDPVTASYLAEPQP